MHPDERRIREIADKVAEQFDAEVQREREMRRDALKAMEEALVAVRREREAVQAEIAAFDRKLLTATEWVQSFLKLLETMQGKAATPPAAPE